LRTEVIEAGITDLALNELRLLEFSPAERAPFRELFSCRLGPAEDNTEPVENGCDEKGHKYDREVGEHVVNIQRFLNSKGTV
jgi:hypothetical protein